jgi:hypothetical protein
MDRMTPESIASLTTAAGTLVLAVATFGSTRTANRASRIAERSLLATLRPVLVHAELGDPRQKIGYADQHWVHVDGPEAVFDLAEPKDVIYLAFGLRNVGSGIAILQGWYPTPYRVLGPQQHPPVDEFRPLTRALYVPPGGLGFWQGALRDPAEPAFTDLAKAAESAQPVTIDVLYSDMNGGQRTITRLSILPTQYNHPDQKRRPNQPVTPSQPGNQDHRPLWIASIGTHWLLDEPAGLPASWPWAKWRRGHRA